MTVKEIVAELCEKTGITIDNVEDISFVIIDNHDQTYRVVPLNTNWMKAKDSKTGEIVDFQLSIPKAKIEITPLPTAVGELWSIIINDEKKKIPCDEFEPIFVSRIPSELEPNKLYISLECNVAIHLCPCGCGEKVVLPLGENGWSITDPNGLVSLTPSIGNYQFPCKSHYWIKDNKVVWAR